jgi:hypothetical protein
MKKTLLLIFSLSSMLILVSMNSPSVKAQSVATALKQIRIVEIDHVFREEFFGENASDLLRAGGVGFPPGSHTLLMLHEPTTDGPSVVLVEPPTGGKGRITLAPLETADPINLALDSLSTGAKGVGLSRLFLLDTRRGQLLAIKGKALDAMNPQGIQRSGLQGSGIVNPQGMTLDPGNGVLYVLDAEGPSILRVTPKPGRVFAGAAVSEIPLPRSLGGLRGLAFNPEDGHLYVINPQQHLLYKLTVAGELIKAFDFPLVGVPQGMIFSPSLDLTDPPEVFHLYLATDHGLQGQVTEWVLPGSLSPRARFPEE